MEIFDDFLFIGSPGSGVKMQVETKDQPKIDQSLNSDIGRGDGVYISTYGCQMNVNDTERMYAILEMSNFVPVNTPDQASVIIINACSVREKPVHKVFSEVGRYRKLKDKNPNLKIGVAGCVAQQEKKKLTRDHQMIDFVVGTDAIDTLPSVLMRLRDNEERNVVSAKFDHVNPYKVDTLIRNPKVSTFVNITKGCDNFCTFCIVPFTRGRERSRAYKDLVEDTSRLVKRGVKELYLLGQNVNSYKSECGVDFAGLLKGLATDTDIERIRYTTSHPKDFNEELMHVMRDYNEKVCEYIHLPVQSGNTEVLERMNRGYSRETYLQKVKMILEILPQATLSTDIIVGFPGETEEQFQDTLTLLEEVPFETIYAYKYSARPFTKAARWEDQLTEAQKSERLARVFEKHKSITTKLAEKYLHMELKVLVEDFNDETGMASGRSTQNRKVYFKGSKDFIGQTMPVKIMRTAPQSLHGEVVQ